MYLYKIIERALETSIGVWSLLQYVKKVVFVS